MLSNKYVSLGILSLIAVSAIAVLIIGIQLAKQERIITTEQDRKPLTTFASRLHGEINELTDLYQSYLIDIRDKVDPRVSNIELTAICRNIVGIEQATLFREGSQPVYLDLRETDRSVPLPLPRRSGVGSSNTGIIVDVTKFKETPRNKSFEWIIQAGHPPHFSARADYRTIIVLRINPELACAEIDSEISGWVSENFDPFMSAVNPIILHNPSGEEIASTGNIEFDVPPDLLLPIPSVFGDWKISSWNIRETIVGYRQPVLVGSASLAVILLVAGIFSYSLQRRAFRMAEQRASFVNRVSHELRTPMTNILLNIDLLSDSLSDDELPQANRLGLIREEASRLSRLIENVLTFSQREKSKNSTEDSGQLLQITSCNVNQIIKSVVSQFSPTLSRKKLVVHQSLPEFPVFASADPDAFSQIISNLISNVEKYAAAGEKLMISVESTPSNETVSISITDFGPGIPVSETARIFQPFVRLSDATTEGVSGTGLGLAIARDLADGMNGKLNVESGNQETHKGSRFILTLPLSAKNIVPVSS